MGRQFGWQGAASVLAIVLFGLGLLLGSYRHTGEPLHSTAAERLRPAAPITDKPAAGGTVYVPVRINCPPEVAILTLRPADKA